MKTELLGSICDINPRKPKELEPEAQCSFIPMSYVDDDLGIVIETETRQIGDVQKGYTYFEDGDVLFAKITPCMENGNAHA